MNVRYEIEPGPDRLRRRIAAFVRSCRAFKIGITSSPKERAASYDEEYDEMILLYKSQSNVAIRDIERGLVDYFWDSDALAPGGGGPLGDPPYYLYVVVRY